MIFDAAELDKAPFPPEQCDTLFAAVQIDDRVDAHTELPAVIRLDYDERNLLDGFRLCRQLWKDGVEHSELVELAWKLARDRDLDAEDRLRYKYARAKLKHFRFSYALYAANHRYPVIMDWMTTAMGHLQDAFKNGQPAAVLREALLLRAFLARGPQYLLHREEDRIDLTSSAGFRHYVQRQVAIIRNVLSEGSVTGEQFHATRKIISRQGSFYDNLRTIEPSAEAFMMSRSMAAINGLMGKMHDELVERRIAGLQDYHHERFPLPEEIARRLTELVARYPTE